MESRRSCAAWRPGAADCSRTQRGTWHPSGAIDDTALHPATPTAAAALRAALHACLVRRPVSRSAASLPAWHARLQYAAARHTPQLLKCAGCASVPAQRAQRRRPRRRQALLDRRLTRALRRCEADQMLHDAARLQHAAVPQRGAPRPPAAAQGGRRVRWHPLPRGRSCTAGSSATLPRPAPPSLWRRGCCVSSAACTKQSAKACSCDSEHSAANVRACASEHARREHGSGPELARTQQAPRSWQSQPPQTPLPRRPEGPHAPLGPACAFAATSAALHAARHAFLWLCPSAAWHALPQ